jgi:hypothetical protein
MCWTVVLGPHFRSGSSALMATSRGSGTNVGAGRLPRVEPRVAGRAAFRAPLAGAAFAAGRGAGLVDFVVFAIVTAFAGRRVTVSFRTGFAAFGAFGDFAVGLAVAVFFGTFGDAAGHFAPAVAAGFRRFDCGAGAGFRVGASARRGAAAAGRPAFVVALPATFLANVTRVGASAGVTGRVARGRAPEPVLIPVEALRSSGTRPLTDGVTDTCVRLTGARRPVAPAFATGVEGAAGTAFGFAAAAEAAFG